MAWNVFSGTPTSSTGAITVQLPFGAAVNDILLLFTQVKDGIQSIADAAGGTWTLIGATHPGPQHRQAVWWSRYNGTQTAPTTNAPGDHIFGVILRVRGAILTGSPVNAFLAAASTFPETVSTATSITTTTGNCLVVGLVTLEGPDVDGTGVFSTWSNAVGGIMTEALDESTSAGVGGSMGMAYVVQPGAGATGNTTITHSSFRIVWLHLALLPTTVLEGDGVLTATLDPFTLTATGTAAGGIVLNKTLDAFTLAATGTVAAGGGPGSGAVPTYVAAGALAESTGAITPALPAGILPDDLLLLVLHTDQTLASGVITIPTPNGGTWAQLITLGGVGVRMTVFRSFYNGTQGAPTTSDAGDHQYGRIFAFRGTLVGPTAINDFAGNQATPFAVTTTTISPAGAFEVLTTVSNCLIVDIVAGDVNAGTGYVFTNSGLTAMTERTDDASAVGLGGTLALNTGTKAVAGIVQETVATHASWRTVYARIALAPIPGTGGGGGTPTVGFTVGPNGRILKNGQAMLGKLLYSPGLTGPGGGNDMQGEIERREFHTRWANKINFYLNVMSGTGHNTLRLCDALLPYNINVICVCNAHVGATADQMGQPFPFDACTDAGGFRALFAAKSNAAGYYVADEPLDTVLQSVIDYVNIFKTQTPSLACMTILVQDPAVQLQTWADAATGDWLGADPYPYGGAPEIHPGGSGGMIDSTYGWMSFSVGHAAAHVRYHALRTGRAPWITLPMWKHGSFSRFMTTDEQWSNMVAVIAEGCNVGWWALGVQLGAIDQHPFLRYAGNDVQTVFASPVQIEEVIDSDLIEVKIEGVVQDPSTYTIQNIGDWSYHPFGNNYAFDNPVTVTMNTPPPTPSPQFDALGKPIMNVVVTGQTWPSAKRTAALNMLDEMVTMLTTYEPTILRDPSPELLTFNSTSTGNPLLWRKNLCNELRQSPSATDRPVWLFGYLQFFQEEWTRLSLATPDTSYSIMFFDQSSNVRARCFKSADGSYALIFAYNIHFNAQNNVTLQWATTVTRVEVLGESRDCVVQPDNRSWIDTFGGGSTLRQGFRRQGHVYKLYLTGAPPPSAPGPPVLTSWGPVSTTVTRVSMVAGTGATTHDLYRGTATGFPRDAAHLIASFGVTLPATYDDLGLAPSTQYFYKLVARNVTGNTESFEISITTLTPQASETGLFWNVGNQDFVSWPGHLRKAQVGTYEFELTARGGPVQPTISGYRVVLDAGDIGESIHDAAIAITTGSRLALTKVYRVIKSVSLTLVEDGGTAVTARVIDKNATLGPLVQCFSAAGAIVAGHVDATIVGY